MTASNLIMEKLDEIKELTNSELALIDQLSVKVLPDKVVNQSERLKGAFINPVTSANGLPKYLAIRLEAINEILKEIQTNWNKTLPEATTHIDTIQSKLDELYSGVNDEYNTLLKIENAIKKEVSDRQTAITNLINGASEDFNTLKEIETKVKQEISDREQAITNLINGASSDYDTLKELETAIKNEVTARSQAITNLINNATANYNTLGKLETRIKEETANRNSAISALKGTATSSNDTLGKLENNLNNEISNREDAIEALINNASSGYQTLRDLEYRIKDEVTARTQAIAQEISDRDSAIKAAIANLVDTAPDLLNTLDELAAALGDDPNFATTVANNIAQSLTTAKEYTDTKISEEVSDRDTAISGAISNLKGAATTNYDTLAKLETRIKEETTNRTSAINNLIGGATESYNTLKELEDAIKTEVTNRTEAISDLIGTATSSYDTLGKIQARIEAISGTEEGGLTIEGAILKANDYTDKKVAEEASARNSAITTLKNGASSGYDTLKELEDAIKKEVSDRASAITQEVSNRNSAITTAINNLKGTATTGYDTLGEIESAIKAETTNRTSAITQAKTDVKNELLGGAGTAFDTLKELADALGNDPNFATTVSTLIGQKQDKLTETQLNAVNSGITQAKVATYDGYATKINSKQDALNSTQQNAINSGITQEKVTKYDGYEATINNKANTEDLENYIQKSQLVNAEANEIIGKIPQIGSDGVVEIGQFIDFHHNDTDSDYTHRLISEGANGVKVYLPTSQGTLATEEYVENKINEISDELILSVDCDHELEITGQTGHEYGKAIPEESNVVLREIQGQTRRKSLNLLPSSAVNSNVNQVINNATLKLNPGDYTLWFYFDDQTNSKFNQNQYDVRFYYQNDTSVFQNNEYVRNSIINFTLDTQVDKISIYCNCSTSDLNNVKVMVLQGTYDSTNLPAFEPYDNTLVNSKATILSTGKNLFNYIGSDYTDSVDIDNNFGGNSGKSATKNYNLVMPNSNYQVQFVGATADSYQVYFYTKDKTLINKIDFGGNANSGFTTPSSCYYIRFSQWKNGTSKKPTNVYLTYGSSTSTDKEYESEETDFLELGAFDIAYPQNNQVVRQTSKMITLNGSENWGKGNTISDSHWRFNFRHDFGNAMTSLNEIQTASTWKDVNENQTWGGGVNNYGIAISSTEIFICNEALTTVDQLKQWLSQNPIKLVYKLAKPTIEEYNSPSGYKVWNGGLQAQLTDYTHVPYKLIKKEYSISLKDQVNANATINVNQQAMLDIFKTEIEALKTFSSNKPPITDISVVGIPALSNQGSSNGIGREIPYLSIGSTYNYDDFKILLIPNVASIINSIASCRVDYVSGDNGYIKYDFLGDYTIERGLQIQATALKTVYETTQASVPERSTTFRATIKDLYNNTYTQDFTVSYRAN